MSTSKKVILIALVALLLVAAAGLFVLYRMRSAEQSPAEAVASASPEPAATATPAPTEAPEMTLNVQEPTTLDALVKRIFESESLRTVRLMDGVLKNNEIDVLRARFPEITFDYRVSVGDTFVPPDTTELSVDRENGTIGIADVADAITFLPYLNTAHLGPSTPEELAIATEQLGGLTLDYSVSVLGKAISPETETLDLSDGTELSAEELSAALPYLPALQSVQLGDRSDDPAGAIAFAEAFPEISCVYSYSVTYDGKTYGVDTELINLDGKHIPDPEALKNALKLLPNLKTVSMLDCDLDDTEMGALADALPNVKVLWEIDLGFWGKLRTDATAFTTRSGKSDAEMAHRLTTEDIQPLRYCTDLVALDLGHQQIEDISCLSSLHKLQVLILADNRISDISALAQMPELVYVELFINYVSDLTPLSGLEQLKDLNICTNRVSDLTPLYPLKSLERLWYSGNQYHLADHQALMAELPDCYCNRSVWPETEDGWRKHERYYWMIAFFEDSPRYK